MKSNIEKTLKFNSFNKNRQKKFLKILSEDPDIVLGQIHPLLVL